MNTLRKKNSLLKNHALDLNATKSEHQNGMKIFHLKLEPIPTKLKGIQKLQYGTPDEKSKTKIIVLLGATGAGKSTLINGMVNYIFGVEWNDDYRVSLIREEEKAADQTRSQTTTPTCYTIHHQPWFRIPYTLTIVDTPGFGDTGGINRDNEITEQISHLFKHEDGLDQMTAVGFVAESALSRLTASQKYVFDSILSLFGKDCMGNIVPLFTFADAQPPKALGAIRQGGFEFNHYFKFNNVALFVPERDQFNHLFWHMCFDAFRGFLEEVYDMKDKSLTLTKELLRERESLKVQIEGITREITTCTVKGQQFEAELKMLQQYESDIAKNKEYQCEVQVEEFVEEDSPYEWNSNNCPKCKRTCHIYCKVPGKPLLYFCEAFKWDGTCRNCPGKCSIKQHEFKPKIYVSVFETKTRTYKEVKQRYESALGEKMSKEKIIDELMKDLEKTYCNILEKSTEARNCLRRIRNIALRPKSLSIQDYIDLMIEREKQEGQKGFQERIDQLKKVKSSADIMEKLENEGFELFKDQAKTMEKVKERYKREGKMADNQCPVM